MPPNLLTVDLGNSRLKLRLWDLSCATPRLLRQGDWECAAGAAQSTLGAWLDQDPPADQAAFCAVGARELEAELRALLAARMGVGAVFTPPHGLELSVREAHTVGLDRLFAARAAADLLSRSALVLDAGTALTVDALEVVGSARVFLGGAIAPGPVLLSQSLSRGTARLARVDPRPGARALGRSTPEALEAGIVVGFRGAARELVAQIGAESGLASAPLVVTGGARSLLLDPPLFSLLRVEVVPDLVHLGLLAAARDALAQRTSAGGGPL